DPLPGRQRIHVEATMVAHPELGGHEALVLEPGQRPAERVRDGHPTLVIDRMLEVAPEHPTRRGGLPHVPRLHHLTPHRPTARRHVHLRGSHCQGNFCAKSTPGERRPPEEVCKPDSVPPPRKRGQQPFVWSPGCPGDRATDPGGAGGPPTPGPGAGSPSYTVLLRVGFTERPPSRADLASSYLAVSPLPRARGPGRSVLCGTFPRLPGAAVDGHPALRSPDFPPASRRAAARPPPARGA